MSYSILVTDQLSEEGLALLAVEDGISVEVATGLTADALAERIVSYDALIVRSGTEVSADVIESAERLRVIGRAGTGVDNIDVEAATRRGIIVMNTPGTNSVAAAEHAMALVLSLSRNVHLADRSLREQKWARSEFVGTELYGKTLGVIGFGRVGREVAGRAKAFQMRILVNDPYVAPDLVEEAGGEVVALERLIEESDYITLHTPLREETRHLLDDREFARMKDGVRIINCARGGLINEEALLEGLKSGAVAGAALDVFEEEPPIDNPLFELDNVVVTPHLGGSTQEAKRGVSVAICSQVKAFLLDGRAEGAINAPVADPSVAERLRPYMVLAEKIGRLQIQMVNGPVRSVEVECRGEVEEVRPISLAVLVGLLSEVSNERVNVVNALHVARHHGIAVTEKFVHDVEGYTNLITVKLAGAGAANVVSGSLLGVEHPRIVRINEYAMDVKPEGVLLITKSLDVPGAIGKIGTLLGAHQVNIGEFRLGRSGSGDVALAAINLDESIGGELLAKLKEIEEVIDAVEVRL